jgi:3-oxoacyl-[acyl-carrier-protein] synthase I
MEGRAIQVVGLGASTPIGRSVWASAAAARAGVCGFSEHAFMVDTAGEPMRVARVASVGTRVQDARRYCQLLFPAMDEALARVRETIVRDRPRLGLALALPPVRPGRPRDLGERLPRLVAQQYPGLFTDFSIFECGHAAGYAALDTALDRISCLTLDACIVAGVDSYLVPETLEWIEACDQFHGAGQQNNAWGFVPGEAASAMVVSSQALAAKAGVDAYGEIAGVGLARETELIKTDGVCIGAGLTRSFRAALDTLSPGERIQNVFCDLNGETYRADEYGFTALRTKDRFVAATDFVAPADCWGDIGAAGGPLHAALGLIAHRKKYGNGPVSLAWGSSESGERGAAVVRAAQTAGGGMRCR